MSTTPGPAAPPDPRNTSAAIRAAIFCFLQERLKAAMAKPGADSKRDELTARFGFATWLGDAARRAPQIRQVTHADSFAHPDAAGSDIFTHGNDAAGPYLVGTHTLGSALQVDAVGNAGALDIYAFLSLEVDGKTLFARAMDSDPALVGAFASDAALATGWMEAFAAIGKPDPNPESHIRAKQVFWHLGGDDYHLLGALFSSPLAHRIWTTLRDAGFSDEARAARAARKDKVYHPAEIHDYPGVVIQKFGGSKPQNISALNTRRHGENYLLPSLPPIPRYGDVRPPLWISSVLDRRFGRRHHVLELIGTLRDYLVRVKDRNNVEIRDTRAALADQIVSALINFAAPIQRLPPGWSAHPDCRLPLEERYWLDPARSLSDAAFAQLREVADWPSALSHRFGTWLSGHLETADTPMSDRDHQVWAAALVDCLRLLPEVTANG